MHAQPCHLPLNNHHHYYETFFIGRLQETVLLEDNIVGISLLNPFSLPSFCSVAGFNCFSSICDIMNSKESSLSNPSNSSHFRSFFGFFFNVATLSLDSFWKSICSTSCVHCSNRESSSLKASKVSFICCSTTEETILSV